MRIPFLLGITVLAGAVLAAGATTINLTPVADTGLRSNSPDSNSGTATSLPIGVSKNGSPVNRALLEFDLSGLPANAVINSATLNVSVTKDPSGSVNYDLNRMLTAWDESQATWNNRLDGVAWSGGGGSAGTDFSASASATTSLSSGPCAFSSAALASDVQFWVSHPEMNYGWVLLADGEPSGSGEQIGAREDPDTTPTLTVDYSVPVTPDAPLLTGPMLTGNAFHFSFNAQAGVAYVVEYRHALNTGSWNLLTNILAPGADTVISITNLISGPASFYRVHTP